MSESVWCVSVASVDLGGRRSQAGAASQWGATTSTAGDVVVYHLGLFHFIGLYALWHKMTQDKHGGLQQAMLLSTTSDSSTS